MFLSVTDAIWELVETFYGKKYEIIAPWCWPTSVFHYNLHLQGLLGLWWSCHLINRSEKERKKYPLNSHHLCKLWQIDIFSKYISDNGASYYLQWPPVSKRQFCNFMIHRPHQSMHPFQCCYWYFFDEKSSSTTGPCQSASPLLYHWVSVWFVLASTLSMANKYLVEAWTDIWIFETFWEISSSE